MNHPLVETARPGRSIFAEARSLRELFFVESRCEQELYEAAKRKDRREIERLMPMYSDLRREIEKRLRRAVRPASGVAGSWGDR